LDILPRNFYARDTLAVAQELVGKTLVRQTSKGGITAKIVEVEAYKGRDDPASHAYRGKTARNQLMFGNAGFAYVYFIYGNHFCLNATTEIVDVPGAVLVRAVEITAGVDLACSYRKTENLIDLTNGPGKLTQALQITRAQNGVDLTMAGELFITAVPTAGQPNVTSSKRIGIKQGFEKPWRFYLTGNRFVSKR
jgi:DNA-3-methyladenine glycosylase